MGAVAVLCPSGVFSGWLCWKSLSPSFGSCPFPCKRQLHLVRAANGSDTKQIEGKHYCLSISSLVTDCTASACSTPRRRQVTPVLLQLCSREDCRLRVRKRGFHVSGRISPCTVFLLVCIICNCCWRADRDKKWTVRRSTGRTRVCVFIIHSFLCNQEDFQG